MSNRGSYVILMSLFAFRILCPQTITPPFDVNQVIEEVSRTGACLAPTTGEFLLDTNVIYRSIPQFEETPAVAFDGTNYLVVWRDQHDGYRICGTRIGQSGTILDPAGIVICSSTGVCPGWPYRPGVAFDGTNYLVVWDDFRNEPGFGDVYGARVATSGAVLDSLGFPISIAPQNQSSPVIAFDGTNYLVVWYDHRPGTNDLDIYGARVAPSGTVLDPGDFAISAAANAQLWPAVAFGGSNFLVIWSDTRISPRADIFGARVSTSGSVLDTTGILISQAPHEQTSASLAFDGTNFLAVWEAHEAPASYVCGARVTRSGTVLDPEGIPISPQSVKHVNRPHVAFGDTNYFVMWAQSNATNCLVCGTRVDQSGVVLDSAGITVSTRVNLPYFVALASGDKDFLVVWEDWDSAYDVFAARVAASGVVIDTNGFCISNAANYQTAPSVAFDGVNYLAVWQDWRGSDYAIHGLRLSPAGTILDATSIAVSATSDRRVRPSAAFGGSNHLVVWRGYDAAGNSGIRGARVARTGAVLDPNGFMVSPSSLLNTHPAAAFDGTNYFVVWEEGVYKDIYGARVSQAGIVLDPNGILISTGGIGQQRCPSLAFDGTNYLVLWQDDRDSISPCWDIYGTRVARSGNVLDPSGIAISRTSTSYYERAPSVAFDGANYLVVWEDARNNRLDIYATRVNPQGVVLDTAGIQVCVTPDHHYSPSVAFDGNSHVVVWTDCRNGYYQPDIRGARVTPGGTVVDSFEVSARPWSQAWSSISHGPGNQTFVTYSGWTDSINSHPANAMRIWGKFLPLVGIEEARSKRLEARNILQICPNPFLKSTKVSFGVAYEAKNIELKIFDVSGRVVKNFRLSSIVHLPSQVVSWNGDDNAGRTLPAGVYFCRLETKGISAVRKIVKLQ